MDRNMTSEEKQFIPLHKATRDAEAGDSGWVWFDRKWRTAQIVDVEDEGPHVIMILDDEVYWFSIEHEPEIASAPWFPIHEPPYDGNEVPSTHCVVIECGRATVTISWRIDTVQGENTLAKIAQFANEQLQHPVGK